MRELTLERGFPSRDEAVIDPEIGGEQRALGSHAKVLERAELDFDLAGLGDGGIRAVERAIGLDLAGACQRCSQCRDGSKCPHEAGRNTQIAAGSLDPARVATNSRSSSGTNSDVRAPDTVGTRATRR